MRKAALRRRWCLTEPVQQDHHSRLLAIDARLPFHRVARPRDRHSHRRGRRPRRTRPETGKGQFFVATLRYSSSDIDKCSTYAPSRQFRPASGAMQVRVVTWYCAVLARRNRATTTQQTGPTLMLHTPAPHMAHGVETAPRCSSLCARFSRHPTADARRPFLETPRLGSSTKANVRRQWTDETKHRPMRGCQAVALGLAW